MDMLAAFLGKKSDFTFKILVVGDPGVGKSSLIRQFGREKKIEVEEKVIQLQIQDVGSGPSCTEKSVYYQRSQGVIIVYDVTDKRSINKVMWWLLEIEFYAQNNLKMLLVGNKNDMTAQKAVDHEKAKVFAHRHDLPFLETSAQDGTNVEQVFLMITTSILANFPKVKPDISTERYIVGGCKYIFRIFLIGDPRAGNSCLLRRFVKDTYTAMQPSTISMDFEQTTINVEGKNINLLILDSSGLDGLRSLRASTYGRMHGILITYDCTEQFSFDKIKNNWLPEIHEGACENVCKILVANKADDTERKVVDYAVGKALADELGIPFLETSSRNGTNVEKAFKVITASILDRLRSKASQ